MWTRLWVVPTAPKICHFMWKICWTIWKARNSFVFSGKYPNPSDVIEKAKAACRDYLAALFKCPNIINPPKASRASHWSAPPPDVVKFNSDGAFKSFRSLAAFGVIARDCGGSALVWRMGKIVAHSAIVIEAWALRIACSTAVEMDYNEVIFESNCQALINCFKDGKPPCPWEIRTIVDDIRSWAKTRKWSFVWCSRDINTVAHGLAAFCADRFFVFQAGCLPPAVEVLVSKDVNRS
ncbi:uncharacterized protein LOC131321162 [Rhododendron vialii]|uniref:uncharacterized protein LOC131321162 n=1 Tax=Rhododendron vialii TaxID=182163 RepID=UPI0026604A41|nr:uncharacterized protein LOC131321162 [Rhododendron vialii]